MTSIDTLSKKTALLGVLALSLALGGSARAQVLERVHLGDTVGTAIHGTTFEDGEHLLDTLGEHYGTRRPAVSSIAVPRNAQNGVDQFTAGGLGAFARTQSVTIRGTQVHVYSNGRQVALAIQGGKGPSWLAGQIRARRLAFQEGAGFGGARMAQALAERLDGAQGAIVEDMAVANFLQGIGGEVDADAPEVARFEAAVARMDTSTGILTFDDAKEAKELSDRALGLLRDARAPRAGAFGQAAE